MSLLAKQIAHLHQQSNLQERKKDDRGSQINTLLFSASTVGEIDAVALLEVAVEALSELSQREQRFQEYMLTLFHSSSASLDRDLLSPEENSRLDSSISRFLLLLSPFFLTRSALRVLEYLVRIYHVERRNVESLMECCLIHHDSSSFSKVIKILNLEGTYNWGFLKGFRQRGATLTRTALAERLAHDPALVAFVNNMLFKLSELARDAPSSRKSDSEDRRLFISWYSATIVSSIEFKVPSDDFLRALLPQVLKGLAFCSFPAVQVGFYIVVMKLVSHNVLPAIVCDQIIATVVKSQSAEFSDHAFICAATIANCTDFEFSERTITALIQQNAVKKIMSVSDRVDVSRILSCFALKLLEKAPRNNGMADVICEILACDSPVEAFASALFRRAVAIYLSESDSPEACSCIGKIIHVCIQNFPTQCDSSVRSYLDTGSDAERQSFISLLSSSPRHTPLPEFGTTFFFALEHENPQARTVALKRAIETFSSRGEVSVDLHSVLLRRVEDEDPGVVQAWSCAAGLDLLSACCSTCHESTVALLWRTFEKWSKSLWIDFERCSPVIASLLTLITDATLKAPDDRLAQGVAVLAHLQVLPSRAKSHFFLKASSSRQAQISHLWRTAITNAGRLSTSGAPFSIFSGLARLSSLEKKSADQWADQVTRSLSPQVSSTVFSDHTWAQIAGEVVELTFTSSPVGLKIGPSVRTLLVDSITEAAKRGPAIDLSDFSFFDFLQKSLSSLSHPTTSLFWSNTELLDSIFLLLSTISTKIVVVDESNRAVEGLLSLILSLPACNFSHGQVQEALRHLISRHLHSKPQLFLASVFAEPSRSCVSASVRALAIAKSFTMALLEDGVPTRAIEDALSQCAAIFPHLLFVCGHPTKQVRLAALDFLETLCSCSKLSSITKAAIVLDTRKPSNIRASDLFKLCGALVNCKADISMDERALGPSLNKIFAREVSDRAWNKVCQPCLNFIFMLLENLGKSPAEKHVCSAILKSLSDGAASCVLEAHFDLTWPCCSSLLGHLLEDSALTVESQQAAANGIVTCILDAYVFLPGLTGLTKSRLGLLESSLSAFGRLGGQKSPIALSRQEIFEHCLKMMTSAWSACLQQDERNSLCGILLEIGCSGLASSNLVEAISRVSPSPEHCLRFLDSASKSPVWPVPCSFVVEALGELELKFANIQSPLDLIMSILQRLGASECDDEVSYCTALTLELMLRILSKFSEVNETSSLRIGFVESSVDFLRRFLNDRSDRAYSQTIASIVLHLAKMSPTEVMTAITFMIEALSRESDSTDDFQQFRLLSELLPHVKDMAKRSTIGDLLRDISLACRGASSQRKLGIFVSLVNSLSPEILPALIVLGEPTLASPLALRVAPVAQVAASVKLLECAKLCFNFEPSSTKLSLFLGRDDDKYMTVNLCQIASSRVQLFDLSLKCLDFIASHLESRGLHLQLLKLNTEDEHELQRTLLKLCQHLFSCSRDATEAQSSDFPFVRISEALDRILQHVQNLLSVPGFIAVIQELLLDDELRVRLQALDMLMKRLQHMRSDRGISQSESALFIDMLQELMQFADGTQGSADIQTTALCAIDVLARNFPDKSVHFSPALEKVSSLLERQSEDASTCDESLCASFACAASLCGILGAAAFPYLPKLLPLVLKRINSLNSASTDDISIETTNLMRSALSVLVSMAQHLTNFFHPYLRDIILLTQNGVLAQTSDSTIQALIMKLYGSLSSGISIRLALPIITEVMLASLSGYHAVRQLMSLFCGLVASANQRDLKTHMPKLSVFILEALRYRENSQTLAQGDIEDIDQVEMEIIEGLFSFVTKMNEKEFFAFFIELYEWKLAHQQNSDVPSTANETISRRISFYRVTHILSDRLKSLFTPMFEHFFDDCKKELLFLTLSEGDNSLKPKKKKQKVCEDSINCASRLLTLNELDRPQHIKLLEFVFGTLQKCFENDEALGFVTKERAEFIVKPVIQHLTLASVETQFVLRSVVPCIAHLAASRGCGEVLWKSLNYQVLVHMRDSCAQIRLASLAALKECFSLVGEEFLSVLPESLSFLSELLDDKDPAVEAKCREVLHFVEQLSGEKLEAYL